MYVALKFMDTSIQEGRQEVRDDKGSYFNSVEIEEVDQTLNNIDRVSGNINLKGKIFVSSPYKAQVENKAEVLREVGHFLNKSKYTNDEKVELSTVDSLQGNERSIVILPMIQSNSKNAAGFLNDDRRLNEATSRACIL